MTAKRAEAPPKTDAERVTPPAVPYPISAQRRGHNVSVIAGVGFAMVVFRHPDRHGNLFRKRGALPKSRRPMLATTANSCWRSGNNVGLDVTRYGFVMWHRSLLFRLRMKAKAGKFPLKNDVNPATPPAVPRPFPARRRLDTVCRDRRGRVRGDRFPPSR